MSSGIAAVSSTAVLSPPTTSLPLPEHSGEGHSLQLPVLSVGAHFLASLCLNFLICKAEGEQNHGCELINKNHLGQHQALRTSAIVSIMSPVTHGLELLPKVETREAHSLCPPHLLRSLPLKFRRHLPCYPNFWAPPHTYTTHTCNLTCPPLYLLPSCPPFNFLVLFSHF